MRKTLMLIALLTVVLAGCRVESNILRYVAHIGEPPGKRGGCRHCRTDQMGSPAATLTAFEIAVRCRGAAFLRLDQIVVHADTHGTAGFAPFETRFLEDVSRGGGLGRWLLAARGTAAFFANFAQIRADQPAVGHACDSALLVGVP